MIEVLKIIAESWPITLMVLGLAAVWTTRYVFKRTMDDKDTVRNLNAKQAVVVRNRHEGG